ncbi:MAG: cytochrome C oxidase subunit II [Rhodospirillaceae bacterium]|nr:cytochrome C oxidase subunit II [Rhodospirillaceae bacterium]
MALTPPSNRLWWNEPLDRVEFIWIGVAFVWGLVMFGTMVAWHFIGQQNLSNEAYRIKPEKFAAKVDEMVAQYTVREEGTTAIPVVHPPPGSEVYMLARSWDFYPILELEEGQSYRLHLSSMDWLHGFSLQPTNINIQIHPEYDMVITMTPPKAGTYGIVCNEFCGLGHHEMAGRIYVVKGAGAPAGANAGGTP